MKTSGWSVFAGVMLAMAGAFSMVNGLIALFEDEVYLVGEQNIVLLDLTQWGWVHFIGGGIVLAAGVALTSGQTWARVVGVIVAFLHALSQVAFIEAYPGWTLATLAIDVIVIYGCLVHGEQIDNEIGA